MPYIAYTNKFFYHGDQGDISAWRGFESYAHSRLNCVALVSLQQASNEMSKYLQKLRYEPANYKFDENRIEVKAEQGFTLVKDSYFPYWSTKTGQVLSTSQGFMLVYMDGTIISLHYGKPAIDTVATIVSLTSFAMAVIVVAIGAFSRKRKPRIGK